MAEHSRTYGWTPVEQIGPPLRGRSGLDYFSALRDGTLPPQPIAVTIGWRVVDVEAGRIRLAFVPAEHLVHGGGVVHGGVIATLLDSAQSGAVMSTAPAGALCSTLQLGVQYLGAVKPGSEEIFAEGRVTHRGRTVAAAEGWIEDGAGQVFARGTATVLITEGKV